MGIPFSEEAFFLKLKFRVFCHYQLQFNENAIKSLLKTHEPIFHGHEIGDSPFHGLCQAHENSIKYYLT